MLICRVCTILQLGSHRSTSRILSSFSLLPSPPFLSPFSSPSLASLFLPLIRLGDLGEHCKLLQRVWAEPGRQTHFGEFKGKNTHFMVYYTHKPLLAVAAERQRTLQADWLWYLYWKVDKLRRNQTSWLQWMVRQGLGFEATWEEEEERLFGSWRKKYETYNTNKK